MRFEPIVLQPVSQLPNPLKLVNALLAQGSIEVAPQEMAILGEVHPQALEINLKIKRVGGRMKVRPVNEERSTLCFVEHRKPFP